MNGQFVKLLTGVALGSVAMFGAPLTANVAMTGAYGISYDGYGVGPYGAKVNNLTVPVGLICDDFTDHVSGTESWTATVETLDFVIANGTGAVGTVAAGTRFQVATSLYEQVAYLAQQLYAAPTTQYAALQTAIWSILDPGDSTLINLFVAGTGGTTSWVSAAQNYVSSHTTAQMTLQFANVEILSPTSIPAGYSKMPQEFIYITPEPATYALFGMGIVLLSLGTFRRRAKKTN